MNNQTKPIDVLAACVPIPEAGCWIWPNSGDQKGYGRCRHNGRTWATHRLAWTQQHGPIPRGMLVCHKCDTPACCNPDHLFLGTAQDNARDRDSKGRQVAATCGATNPVKHSSHHQAKLTDHEVKVIREMTAMRELPQGDIAKLFGVSQPCISAIHRGHTWYPERRQSRATARKNANVSGGA